MATGTAYPTGTLTRYLSTGWSAYNNGTAGVWATVAATYLADASDTTWVQQTTAPGSGRGYVIGLTGGVTVGAGTAIARARVAGRISGSGVFSIQYLTTGSAAVLQALAQSSTGTAVTDWVGGWTPPPTAGTSWSTATLNAGSIYVDVGNTSMKVVQLRLEYDMTTVPTASVANTTNTDKPVVSWTYTDGDGQAQGSAVVKIYTAAQYGAAGFSPDTSTATFSTVLAGAGTTVTSTAALPNATVFRSYVQVVKDYSPAQIRSNWATANGTVSFSAPTNGTVTPTWDSTYNRVQVVVAGSASPFRYTLTRNGTVIGRALTTMGAGVGGAGTVYDYQAPRGTAVVYSLVLTTGTAASPQLSSGTATGTVTTGTATGWEIVSLEDPTTVYQFSSPVTGISFNRSEGQSVFRPLDATKAVVVSGAMTGDDGQIQWLTSTRSAWETLKTVLTAQSPLRVTSPFIKAAGANESWIVRLTSREWTSGGVPANPTQQVSAGFVEVDPVDYGL